MLLDPLAEEKVQGRLSSLKITRSLAKMKSSNTGEFLSHSVSNQIVERQLKSPPSRTVLSCRFVRICCNFVTMLRTESLLGGA
jgi:hypothetical protein